MDKLIEGRFREHELADIVLSVSGIGPVLGAEFLAAVGGGLDEFDSPDALAAFAGVAPAPRDSGKVSGDLHRPVIYHRRLQRTDCLPRIMAGPRNLAIGVQRQDGRTNIAAAFRYAASDCRRSLTALGLT